MTGECARVLFCLQQARNQILRELFASDSVYIKFRRTGVLFPPASLARLLGKSTQLRRHVDGLCVVIGDLDRIRLLDRAVSLDGAIRRSLPRVAWGSRKSTSGGSMTGKQWLAAVQDHVHPVQVTLPGMLGDAFGGQHDGCVRDQLPSPAPALIGALVYVAVIARQIAATVHLGDELSEGCGAYGASRHRLRSRN
jgi:hypothetical protein